MHRYFNDILKQVDENYVEKKVSVKQKPSIEEIELVEDLELEFPEEVEKEQVQNLFDGYLGEQREVPNPLEYGPNATYRNLREGIVYKKGPDNLWEIFVKDGQNGKQGARGASVGSGTGVEEVRKEIGSNTIISNLTDKSTYVSSETPILSKYSLPVRYLDRPVRVATFGDSKADWTAATPLLKTDTEDWYTPITSANSTINYTSSKIWLRNRKNYIVVANGGYSGQTTPQMLSRSTSAYVYNRKAIQDIISKNPDVVLFRGNINDITGGITSALTDDQIMSSAISYFNNYKQLVNLVTDAGIPVIDTGALGYSNLSATSTKLIDNRVLAIKIIEQLIDSETTNNPLWRRLDCEGVIVSAGRFLDNMSSDGIHMIEFGGFKLSELEDLEIKKLYIAKTLNLTNVYDIVNDFANYTVTAGYAKPLNRNINLTNSVILSSSMCGLDKWVIDYSTSSNTNSIQISISNFRVGWLSGLTSGDNFLIRHKINVTDLDDIPVKSGSWSRRFRPYTSANTNYLIYEDIFYNFVDGNVDYLAQNAIPDSPGSLGTSTQYFYILNNLPQGTHKITISPEYMYKY